MHRSLSKEYENDFDALLAYISEAKPKHKPSTLGICWPEAGTAYPDSGGLMAIGRATNGSGNPFELEEIGTSTGRESVLCRARQNAEEAALAWVGGKRHRGTIGSRSSFWRVVRATLRVLRQEDFGNTWWDGVAWSNLAKIAPADKGNPADWLGQLQSPKAWSLVQREVEELNPSTVLMITGRWMDGPRLESIDAKRRRHGVFVKHSANHAGRIWLVVERPEFKAEGPIIKEIETALAEFA